MSAQMMAEFARAKARLALVPKGRRPVVTTAHVVTRAEHLATFSKDSNLT